MEKERIKKIVRDVITDEQMKMMLGEGLIMTHSFDKVADFLQRYMSNRWDFVFIKNQNIIGFIPKTNNRDIDYVIKYMNNMGYFLASYYKNERMLGSNYNGNDWDLAKFEAKFDIEYTPQSRYLYHVTDEKYLPKILKNGLIPKSKNKISKHPDRIYLATNEENMFEIGNIFIEDGFIENIIYLKISLNKLYNKFLIEPQFPGGIYTTQNIPPTNIEILE